MNFDRSTELDLDRFDRLFKLGIETGYTPFLGLQKSLFQPEIRSVIREKLTGSNSPFADYMTCLSKWPAVFLAYLTIYVAEGFGEHGTYEVYPFILKALGLNELTLHQKDKLWKAYRTYGISLGLSVSSRRSGANFMVEEYLRQAGVPLKYVPELTDKMMRYANIVGLPDSDDPSALRLWHQGLSERLTTPFPKTVRKAVEADDTCYYILMFLKLLEQPSNVSTAEDFESIMSMAIHSQAENARRTSQQRGRGIGIPQVVCRDQQLGVELPLGESSVWRITVGKESTEFRGMLESRFIPFDQELPTEVQIEHVQGQLSRKLSLWEDSKNNRLLIFSSEGILVAGTQLGAEKSVALEPGNYHLILRFIPDNLDDSVEEIRNDPALYALTIFLRPGQQLMLSKGPASVSFTADSKPLLLWEGESVTGVRGHELFCSTGTHLKVIIPSELIMGGEVKYLVRLSTGATDESVQIPVENSSEGNLDIDIAAVCKKWKPGVIRILAELQRIGLQRSIARSAAYIWNGLQRIENRTIFHCDPLPGNINIEESDNLLIDSKNNLLTFRNNDNRFFRMVFNLSDNKRLTFASIVPGVFIQLKDYSGSHLIERSVKKGSTLSVAWNSRSVLEIFSTTNGILLLGDFHKKVNFKSFGCKRLPLSGLVEYLGPNADILKFADETTEYVEDLVRLVSPHAVLCFNVNRQSHVYKILFTLAHEASAVGLTASDILSGRAETLLLDCDSFMEKTASGINGCMVRERSDEGHFNYDIEIQLDHWPDGAWIIDLDVSINGRWGGISNVRSDAYKAGFVITCGTVTNSVQNILQAIKEEDSITVVEVLRRVQGKLMVCYSQESWDELSWLDKLRDVLLAEAETDNELVGDLVSLSDIEPPDNASRSWIPMRSIAAWNPGLFAKPLNTYQKMMRQQGSLFIRTVQAMGLLEIGVLPLIVEGYLHHLVAFGFTNVFQMQTGAKPSSFHLQEYKKALQGLDLTERMRLLEQENWEPAIGDFLGAIHYLFVIKKMEERYENSLAGNEFRRGKALFVCRNIHHAYLPECPPHLSSASHIGYLSDEPEQGYSTTQQMVLEMSRFLSLLAKACRWDVRHEGTLKKFTIGIQDQLRKNNETASDVLSYVFFIGKELFGFYLLLWEVAFKADYDDQQR